MTDWTELDAAPSRSWRDAIGAVPRRPGSPRAEERIRELRDDQPPLHVQIDIHCDPMFGGDAELARRVLAMVDDFESTQQQIRDLYLSPAPVDDLLPQRTPGAECIDEWERLRVSSETAEHLEASFEGNRGSQPPAAPGSPESDAPAAPSVRASAADAGAFGGTSVSAPGAGNACSAPGFLDRCVLEVVEHWPKLQPPTQFDIAGVVEQRHPKRWAETSIRKKVSDLEALELLDAVDRDGRSPNGAPCWRYALTRTS